jgi:hypothetical protein
MYSRFAAALPTGYISEAEDVAETYLYLMQERFSTRQMIVVDGRGVLFWVPHRICRAATWRDVPGIEASEDKMSQGRLFAYADTQMYRLGANYKDLPINRPLVLVNNNQDGKMNYGDRKGEVN